MKMMKAEPVRLRLAAQFEELKETSAGWTYWMWAQYFDEVNDRGMFFFNGSFTKTILDRADRNKVKIHDGHNRGMTATETLGAVLPGAEQTGRGVRYQGFLTRSAETTAEKIHDGTISENSVEVLIMKADRIEIPLDDVPEQVRPFVRITTNGTALVTGVREVLWWAVGLVPASSQDRDALIEPPTAVAFQDLPVSLSRWDPVAAAGRVSSWAGEGNVARLGRAHVTQLPGGECFGQIADVEDGKLVVVQGALDYALSSVRDGLKNRLPDAQLTMAVSAAAAQVGRYGEKLATSGQLGSGNPATEGAESATIPEEESGERLTTSLDRGTNVEMDAVLVSTALEGGAEPPTGTPSTPSTEPPATGTHSDEGSQDAAASLNRLAGRVKLLQVRYRAHKGVSREPTGPSRKPTPAGAAGLE